MEKLKVIGLLILFIGFMCLYANKMQDEVIANKVAITQQIDMPLVDAQVVERKIQLFMYEDCQYCINVITFLQHQNLMDKVVFIDASIAENNKLLRSLSGKTQAPYLVDFDAGVQMPESLDIIAYLNKKFSITKVSKVEIDSILIPVKISDQNKYNAFSFLSDVQASKKPVIILVSTTWCPPCKIFKPIFLEIAQKFSDTCEFICIDGDLDRIIVDQLGVQCYPSIVCYKHGKKINPKNYRSQDGLINLIKQLTSD